MAYIGPIFTWPISAIQGPGIYFHVGFLCFVVFFFYPTHEKKWHLSVLTQLEDPTIQEKEIHGWLPLVGCIVFLCIWAESSDLAFVHSQTVLLVRIFEATDVLLLIPTAQFSFIHIFQYEHFERNGDWEKGFQRVSWEYMLTSICWLWEMSIYLPLDLLKI